MYICIFLQFNYFFILLSVQNVSIFSRFSIGTALFRPTVCYALDSFVFTEATSFSRVGLSIPCWNMFSFIMFVFLYICLSVEMSSSESSSGSNRSVTKHKLQRLRPTRTLIALLNVKLYL